MPSVLQKTDHPVIDVIYRAVEFDSFADTVESRTNTVVLEEGRCIMELRYKGGRGPSNGAEDILVPRRLSMGAVTQGNVRYRLFRTSSRSTSLLTQA